MSKPGSFTKFTFLSNSSTFMKKTHLTVFFLFTTLSLFCQTQKTQLLILGCDHLNQIYKKDIPATDVLTPTRQKELAALVRSIAAYNPDMILIERLPGEQATLDSLFTLYASNKLKLTELENGRSEVFQLAFPVAKNKQLKKIYCVDSEGGTSQGVLDNGTNIELYKKEGAELKAYAGEKYKALQQGSLSLNHYLVFLNQPETYNKVYHLRYITPARVTHGTFKNPDSRIDTAFIDTTHIGAELISVFKNRDYKIYSNIVTKHLAQKPKRMLLIIGVAHVGSLKSIFRDDAEFELVDALRFLKK